jgi:hypothetical protein
MDHEEKLKNKIESESEFWIQLCEINEEKYKRNEQKESFLSYFMSIGSNSRDEDEKKFWCLLLEETNSFTTFILSLNIIILTILFIYIYIISRKEHFLSSFLKEISFWMISSLACLYFSPSKSKPQQNDYENWTYVGYFILFLRLSKFIVRFIKICEESNYNQDLCMMMEEIDEFDTTIIIPVLKILLDIIQGIIITSVIFPFPWTPIYVASETALQLSRLSLCLKRANLNNVAKGNNLSVHNWILCLASISIVLVHLSLLIASFAKINAQRNNQAYSVC